MKASLREPGPLTRAFVTWVLRHGRLLWVMAVLLAIPAAYRTAVLYAHLRSDLEELLPRSAPSVTAIEEMRRRNNGLQYLGVLVDTGTAANLPVGERFLDDLAARIRTYPQELVRDVRVGSSAEHQFIEKHAPLYVDLADLQEIARRVEARRDYEVSKEMDMLLEDEQPPSVDLSDIEKKYRDRVGAQDQRESDRFSNPADHLTMLFVEAGGFSTGVEKAREILSRVKADVAALDPAKYAPGMRVGYASDIAISVEEFDALQADLGASSVLVILAVVAVLLAYYRWPKSIIVLIPPLLIATVYAFCLASLPPFNVTALNSNTAFLGSIIIGNGINFGIVLLARYREERLLGVDPEQALVAAVWGARAGTFAAALAAGVSYASLIITEFRGFRQFGYIGGLGMIASWACAFVLMPSLIYWLEMRQGAPAKLHAARNRVRRATIMAQVVKLVKAAPVAVSLVALVLTAGAAIKVSRFNASELEYDFSKLRRYDTWIDGEGYWGRRMDKLLGHYLTPTIVMLDSVSAAEKATARMKAAVEHGPLQRFIATVRTIDDVLPLDQPAKIAEIAHIKQLLTPRVRAAIAPEKRKKLDEILGNDPLAPITIEDIPHTLLTGLRERDGSLGKQVLLYPRPSRDLWQAQAMADFTGSLRKLADVGDGKPGRIAGSIPLSSDISQSIAHDAPIASLASLLGVVGVVIAVLRGQRAVIFVLSSLIAGVLWLGAATMLLGVRVNFANFIAFPITFGIGVDYAVNVMARYTQDGEDDVSGAILSTGGAVGLCSLTTIIGYSSLLLAKNRALFYFGLVAVLGEVFCLASAVIVLPAVLVWLKRRREPGSRQRTDSEPSSAV